MPALIFRNSPLVDPILTRQHYKHSIVWPKLKGPECNFLLLFYLFSCARAAPSSRECWGKARRAVPDKHGVVKVLDFFVDLGNTERLLSLTGSIGLDRIAGLIRRSLLSLLIILSLSAIETIHWQGLNIGGAVAVGCVKKGAEYQKRHPGQPPVRRWSNSPC